MPLHWITHPLPDESRPYKRDIEMIQKSVKKLDLTELDFQDPSEADTKKKKEEESSDHQMYLEKMLRCSGNLGAVKGLPRQFIKLKPKCNIDFKAVNPSKEFVLSARPDESDIMMVPESKSQNSEAFSSAQPQGANDLHLLQND